MTKAATTVREGGPTVEIGKTKMAACIAICAIRDLHPGQSRPSMGGDYAATTPIAQFPLSAHSKSV